MKMKIYCGSFIASSRQTGTDIPILTLDTLDLYKELKSSELSEFVVEPSQLQGYLSLHSDELNLFLYVKDFVSNSDLYLGIFGGVVANFISNAISSGRNSRAKIKIKTEDISGHKIEADIECDAKNVNDLKDMIGDIFK